MEINNNILRAFRDYTKLKNEHVPRIPPFEIHLRIFEEAYVQLPNGQLFGLEHIPIVMRIVQLNGRILMTLHHPAERRVQQVQGIAGRILHL
jgi:hypothetical protein